MTSQARGVSNWNRSPWRYLMWGGAAGLLMLPAIAMQIRSEVNWDSTDFLVMGTLFAAACGTVELGASVSANWAYRAGIGVGVAASFLMGWINLAVGMIGAEGNIANLMFAAVVGVAIAGAVIAAGRARGLAIALAATAAAQAAVTAIAVTFGMGAGEPGWPARFSVLMAVFVALWLTAAWLFRTAARAD